MVAIENYVPKGAQESCCAKPPIDLGGDSDFYISGTPGCVPAMEENIVEDPRQPGISAKDLYQLSSMGMLTLNPTQQKLVDEYLEQKRQKERCNLL